MPLILLVDDHPLFRDGFAHMVRALRPAWQLSFADRAARAVAEIDALRPDLAILDIGLPDEDGFALLVALAARAPDLPQVLLSGRNDVAVRVRARSCGAKGFIAKTMPPSRIIEMLDAVLEGGTAFEDERVTAAPHLSLRQAEVLELLAEGHGNKEMRYRLGIAERTVRAHMTDLFQLLGAHSRTQAIIRAREFGLIE
jgi:DNA-binding NarL/FixJ family response regulator